MPQKTYMYDTQWNQLINAINTGDSSAIVTAISNIKTSIDNIYTRLNAVGFNSTQWDNLVDAINTGDSSAIVTAISNIKNSLDNITNAISNQTITVDLSSINSSNVSNLSDVTGENITNAFNNLNSTLTKFKWKSVTYENLSNSNTNTYYMELTSTLARDLGYNSITPLGFVINSDSGISNVFTLEVSDTIVFMTFAKGTTFSNRRITVTYFFYVNS